MSEKIKNIFYTIAAVAIMGIAVYSFFQKPEITSIGNGEYRIYNKTSPLYSKSDVDQMAREHCQDLGKTIQNFQYTAKSSRYGSSSSTRYDIKFSCQ